MNERRSKILVTGGTGKTGRRLAEHLKARGVEVVIAARSVAGEGAMRFDWSDPGTYAAALRGVDAVYLVAPSGVTDMLGAMQPFLAASLEAGVRRHVLLSASSLPEGGLMMGAVHAWLRAKASSWAVLRPTWFMQNFSEQQHLASIRDEGAIYTATGEGRVAFIDADDIAEAAAKALVAHDPSQRDWVITGPRAITYSEAAAIISTSIGRPVRHVALSEEKLAQRWVEQGLPPPYARALAAMDIEVSRGSEDRVTGDLADLIGRSGNSFEDFALRAEGSWQT